jgi:hypothetical protein
MLLKSIMAILLLIGLWLSFRFGATAKIPEPRIPLHVDTSVKYVLPFKEALSFVRKHGYDTALVFIIDYGIHSGKKRAFLANPSKQVVLDSFLVSHGCGSKTWGADHSRDNPQFSNAPESHCSSLGKYKIGKRAYSDWGTHVKYLLHGLDSTNNNALRRTIVLHGWGDVPDTEVYPSGTPEGWGCPAVSEKAMNRIDSFLQSRKKPVLMWIQSQ